MRTDSNTAAAVLIMMLLLPLAGCLFSREIAHTRRDIEGAYPDLRLKRQIVLNFGPVSLATIRWLADLLPEDEADMAAVYLSDISRVKIGLFRSENPLALDGFDVDHIGFDDDWETAVKVRDDESRVWVLYRDGEDTVRDLYVVVLDEEDLAIARVRGNLNRLLAHIMEDHIDLTRLVGDGT